MIMTPARHEMTNFETDFNNFRKLVEENGSDVKIGYALCCVRHCLSDYRLKCGDTLDFYIEATHFNEQTKEILYLKIQKYTNEFIADYINRKYNKRHTPNYISTIFKGRICDDIAATAQLHYDTFMARSNKLAFKTCTTCGVTKLKDIRNFVRKSRSSDGISSRCKECDNVERKQLKNR